MRYDYHRQADAILLSPEWHRLSGTVCLIPTTADPRPPRQRTTRQTHALQVTRIALKVAEMWDSQNVKMNIGLIRVAALAHDLAQLPFGHFAEGKDVMPKFHEEIYGVDSPEFFRHELNGPKCYQHIMNRAGLRPSLEVCESIREHRQPRKPKSSPESAVVSIADDIATLLSNFADGMQLPSKRKGLVGIYPEEKVQSLIRNLGGHRVVELWEQMVVSWLVDYEAYVESRVKLREIGKSHDYDYVHENYRLTLRNLKCLDRYHCTSPAIRTDKLENDIKSGLRNFWQRCKYCGLDESEALKILLLSNECEINQQARAP